MTAMRVALKILPHAEDLPRPAYATEASAGIDLAAAVASEIALAPGERKAVPTGIALALPAGYEGEIRPRSGLALTHGITILNSPGTIDADYRGEIQVILANLGSATVTLAPGQRIARQSQARAAGGGARVGQPSRRRARPQGGAAAVAGAARYAAAAARRHAHRGPLPARVPRRHRRRVRRTHGLHDLRS